jgi:DNA/RNA-binding domain of Phe-tRNA-synthetase-like protein
VLLGLVLAHGVGGRAPLDFEARLADTLHAAAAALGPSTGSTTAEVRRAAVRDILRNGRYKPTGRAKPANEYLTRAATEDAFPRVNAVVDAANRVSLAAGVPISLWDVDKAASSDYVFRLGREGESYIFNLGGQVIDLLDLICGCRVTAAAPEAMGGEPIVTPVKDSLATKTDADTRNVVACLYVPTDAMAAVELATWLDGLAADLGAPVNLLRPRSG